MSSLAIIAGASVVVGAGMSMYAANKNKQAVNDANKTDQQIATDTNERNYQMWLESRGQLADGTAVNTKLPRWMTARVNGTPTVKRTLVKKGQSPTLANPYSGVSSSPYLPPKAADQQLAPEQTTPEAEKGGSKLSNLNKNALGYGLAGGLAPFLNKDDKRSTVKKVLDPLGIF